MTQFQESIVAKGLAVKEFIEVDFTIKIFGVTILQWHFPPLSKRKSVEEDQD